MALLNVTSPHAHGPLSTASVMQLVLLATLPGIAALVWVFGAGVLINLAIAALVALASEAAILSLRGRQVTFHLKDYSALVTAVLLAIALPPYTPWWVVAIGASFAIVVAKQLYGGLGYNPFNPAMAAYVILLISLPVQMTQWGAPYSAQPMGIADALASNVLGRVDALTSATPLDALKLGVGDPSAIFGRLGGYGWEWVNAAFLIGGLFLLARGIFTWHAPISMLLALATMAFVFPHESQGRVDSMLFHLFSGASMFGAFFIITDPVSSATTPRGKVIFGAAIGVLIYAIRHWGNYPDAVAFAVMLLNLAAPFIDQYTQPRTYGHGGVR
ncbi:MAG TPA: RnfABCDGE type electron transport complex subunit D [Pseudomonadales bacterium]|nr:RnfABCDGE type electron transport complex subunit D [Pseudomonadales bacterium]